jgi:signal transduction histidine kinase
VSMNVPEDVPALQADRHQLCQLFTNLLINGFEALEGRGHVVITVSRGCQDDEHPSGGDPAEPLQTVIVTVSDDGPGIPVDAVERVFNPFFTTKPQGSGLGLAIVRKIVDAHDGRIDMTTPPGGGTAFRVTLPVTGGKQWYQ